MDPNAFRTFMNDLFLALQGRLDPCDLMSSTDRLLDTGAEFATFTIGKPPGKRTVPIWVTGYAKNFNLINSKPK